MASAALGTPSPAAIKRLQQEMKLLRNSPPEGIVARPDESNILLWHYVLTGPKATPYEGGTYLGKLRFPPDYPFAPPSILMTTPNGRFKTDTRLCLSISDYHPKEWNPVWNVSTILTGLLSFMVAEDITAGSMESTADQKKLLAKQSHSFNAKFPTFKAAFPELVEAEEAAALAANPPPPPPAVTAAASSSSAAAAVANGTNGTGVSSQQQQDGSGAGAGAVEAVAAVSASAALFAMVGNYARRLIIFALQLSVAVVALAFVVLLTM